MSSRDPFNTTPSSTYEKRGREICGFLLATLLLIAPIQAGAEPTTPTDVEDANPLEPVLQKIGNDWGVEVDAKRIALNPLKGAVVIRELTLKSKTQGRFLSAPQISVNVDWESGNIKHASIEGASLAVDIGKSLGLKKQDGEKSLGHFQQALLQAVSVSLTSEGVDLLRLNNVSGSATNLGIECKGKRLLAHGAISTTRGEAILIDGATKLTGLNLKGMFKGRKLEVRSLSASLGGGKVSCQGVVPLDVPQKGNHQALRCHLESVRLHRGDFLDVTVTGDVSLSKQSKNYRLGGALDVIRGTVLRPERWGPRRGHKGAFAADVALILKTKSGRATAKIVASAQSGHIEIAGRNTRKNVRLVEDLLQQMQATSVTSGHDSP